MKTWLFMRDSVRVRYFNKKTTKLQKLIPYRSREYNAIVQLMIEQIDTFLPTSWRACKQVNRHVHNLNRDEIPTSLHKLLTDTWKTQADWVHKHKYMLFDFRGAYFGEYIDEVPVSDQSEENDEFEEEIDGIE